MEKTEHICPNCLKEMIEIEYGRLICSNCKILLSERYVEAWNEGFKRAQTENLTKEKNYGIA